MFGIGPMELMAILVVALLVFGPKRIPELARTMGRGLAEFRRASSDLRQSLALDELERDLRQDPTRNQTIHRSDSPSQERPAQAGDDVDPPEPETPTTTGTTTDEKQSGELPLDEEHDHAHHDVASGQGITDLEEVAREAAEKTEPVAGKDSGVPTALTTPTNSKTQTTHPADSELGNVPVSTTKPPDSQRG